MKRIPNSGSIADYIKLTDKLIIWERDLAFNIAHMPPRIHTVEASFGVIYLVDGEYVTRAALSPEQLQVIEFWDEADDLRRNLDAMTDHRDFIQTEYAVTLPRRKWVQVEGYTVWNTGFWTGGDLKVKGWRDEPA